MALLVGAGVMAKFVDADGAEEMALLVDAEEMALLADVVERVYSDAELKALLADDGGTTSMFREVQLVLAGLGWVVPSEELIVA
ncbi:hypothetical protein NDU88_006513 [Pleurodeles waltl]|uniref:Uncharacterized protein n=1 Tax=Pleurodeles waltl TaxID=8319 RepID=A0AAV7MZF0_PLEWA|nr:hypothetical protein NDU88_006513 [Pleurodeles waltl]